MDSCFAAALFCDLHTRKNKMEGGRFLSLKISKIGSFITKSVFPVEGGFAVRLHNLRELGSDTYRDLRWRNQLTHLRITANFPSFRAAYSFSLWILLQMDANTVW